MFRQKKAKSLPVSLEGEEILTRGQDFSQVFLLKIFFSRTAGSIYILKKRARFGIL